MAHFLQGLGLLHKKYFSPSQRVKPRETGQKWFPILWVPPPPQAGFPQREVLHHVDEVGGHPDFNLAVAIFCPFLELREEIAAIRHVRHIDEDPYQIVPVDLSLVLPNAADRLGFAGDCPELLAQLKHGVGDRFVRHGLAVIES